MHNCWRKTRLIEPLVMNTSRHEEEEISISNLAGEDDCIGFVSGTELVRICLNQM